MNTLPPLAALLPWLTPEYLPVPPDTGILGPDESARVQRGMWLHATLPRPAVGTTPHSVIHRQNKLQLRHYPAARPGGQALVIVPSLINKAYICDLEPDCSLVGALAGLGHDVYLVDWGTPGLEDATTSVADVLLDLLHRSIDRAGRHAAGLRGQRGFQPVHLLGYCQGGTLAAMYTALRPERVAGLIALNAPVRFSEGGRFRRFAQDLDLNSAIDPEGLVPVELMATAFKLLDPMGLWSKYLAIESDSHTPARLARTMARERWLEENVPMAGTFAREFVRKAYQEDALLSGTWTVADEPVNLSHIDCPLMVCACEHDFIAPKASVLPLAKATTSTDVQTHVFKTGHIGVVVGSFAPRTFYPLVDQWLREHA